MENSPINEKIVPIERGEEIKLEKTKDRVQKLQEDVISLYGRLIDLENEKQSQLDEELKNPTTAQNIELISLLHEDLDLIKNSQDTLDEIILESFDKLDELRQRIDEINRRVDRGEIFLHTTTF